MGGCASSDKEVEYAAHWKHDAESFQAVGLSEQEIKLLFDPFKRVLVSKVNATGTILVSDLLPSLLKDQFDNPFMMKAIGFFAGEERPEPRVGFKQFVFAYWNICTLSHKCLVRFAADLYNSNKAIDIPIDALKKCITEIHNKTREFDEKDYMCVILIEILCLYMPYLVLFGHYSLQFICSVMEAVREKLDTYQHKPYHIEDFINFCHSFPTAMFPAYEIQAALQKQLFGSAVWTGHSQRRDKQHQYKDLHALYALCNPKGHGTGTKSVTDVSKTMDNHTSSKHRGIKHGSIVPVDSDGILKENGFVLPPPQASKHAHSEKDRRHSSGKKCTVYSIQYMLTELFPIILSSIESIESICI